MFIPLYNEYVEGERVIFSETFPSSVWWVAYGSGFNCELGVATVLKLTVVIGTSKLIPHDHDEFQWYY